MKRIFVSIIVIGLLLMPFLVTVNAEIHRVLKPKPAGSYIPVDDIDMLIFVSPQYANDTEILQAINNYTVAVEEDVNWSIEIVCMSPELNDFKLIDNIMESYYENYSIKACIMVGEDTNTALGSDTDYIEGPSTVPWYTTGGESSYTICEQGIISEPHQMDICISLIYPTHDLDNQTKKSQIISVFDKFSTHRHVYYSGDILVFIDSEIAQIHNNTPRNIYQSMGDYGNLYYKEDPTDFELQNSLEGSYSMYYVDGHANPSSTGVNQHEGVAFQAYYLDQLDTPFFGASGCFVNGWYSNFTNNNRLDPSINLEGIPHYGSMIFTAPTLHVMVLGELTQFGYSYPVSFIEHAVPDLTGGKTLAESMIGHIYCGDCQAVVGDPTFHYSFENGPPSTPEINGLTKGKVGVAYTFYSSATDPDGDQIYYNWSWGDDTYSDWLGPCEPGATSSAKHSWDKKGSYQIRVKAKDLYNFESDWSDPLSITMPRIISLKSMFMIFLERFPHAFPVMRCLIALQT